MSLSIAREIAYDAYTSVMEGGKKPEEALAALYEQHHGSIKRLDRNFVKEIVFGSLRWHSKIYWILQNTSSRDLDKVVPPIRTALVLGTYQIFYMDRVQDRAAVNESVEYVRKKSLAHACSFVNGILRQIARRAEYFAKPDKVNQPADYLSLQFAHPKWVVKRWSKMFKFDRMELILAANNQPPPTSVRINSMQVPVTEGHLLQSRLLKEERTHSDKRPLRSCLRMRNHPRMDPSSIFSQGVYTVQDEAAQLIAHLVDPKEGERVVDACAGPGGKLSHLYELSQGKAKLTAIDRKKKRLEKAQQTCERLKQEGIEWVEADFLEWKPDEPLNKLLIDAPCSGLGVLRRHPEGKWQKEEGIIDRMSKLQKDMIRHGLSLLAEGGRLVFSVCSFEPEETTQHLNWLLNEFPDHIEVESPVAFLPDYYKKYVTRENLLLIYAGNQDAMDGFGAFIIKLKKLLPS